MQNIRYDIRACLIENIDYGRNVHSDKYCHRLFGLNMFNNCSGFAGLQTG